MSWAEIYKAVNNNLDKPLNEQLGIESDEIQALINTWFNKGVVKSVQRGYVSTSSSRTEYETNSKTGTLSFNTINTSKAVLLFEVYIHNGAGSVIFGTLASTSLSYTLQGISEYKSTTSNYTNYYPGFFWTIIEFY